MDDVHEIIWGSKQTVADDVFLRWCQGFEFSEVESSALKQLSGGPCSILASVQAHILKIVHFENENNDNIQSWDLLLQALSNILKKVSADSIFTIAYVEDSENECSEVVDKNSFEYFKSRLKITSDLNMDDLEAMLLSIQLTLSCKFGVLCYLYSVVLTHGIGRLRTAMSDEATCLIDHFHGHSSQCLTNLLLTGIATPYLFDNEKDLGGYILTGITSQPDIGFLTIMEYLRYCEVGWNFKNPRYPIWILGSETHLTVVFSTDQNVIEENSDASGQELKHAEKVFEKMDPDGQGFIMMEKLPDFLTEIGKNSDEESMLEIQTAVDSEDLGILLRQNLIKYLYPDQIKARLQQQPTLKFSLHHYNGLVGSNIDRKVHFVCGDAVIDDFSDYYGPPNQAEATQPTDNRDNSQIIKCLRTKWPTIVMKWNNEDGSATCPSLN